MSAPTEPLTPIVDLAPDRCPSCGAGLAVDQRYCLECGHRRGKPRYTLAAPEPVVPAAVPPAPSSGRFSPGAALLAGLATLLLALGVGVLIGSSGKGARQPVNVSVAGGSAPASASAATTPANAAVASSSGRKAKSGGHHAKSSSHTAAAQPAASKHIAAPTKKLQKAAATASKHVTSTTGQSSIGSKCSGGAGCHGGKQTGVFFGGG